MLAVEQTFLKEKRKTQNTENKSPVLGVGGSSFTIPKPINTEEPSLKKCEMKKILFLPLLIVLVLAAALVWFYINAQPVSNNGTTSNNKNFSYFVINKGSSASQIGTKLESAGLIKNALAFKIYIQFTGQSGKLQPGEFRLTPSFSLFQTIDTLFKGPVELWVTIPEGLRREEIAARFAAGLDKDSTFVSDFLLASRGKEGYLFPDTYLFPLDASASAIVKKMDDTFTSKTQGLTPTGSDLKFFGFGNPGIHSGKGNKNRRGEADCGRNYHK